MERLEWLWNQREAIGAWAMGALVSATVLVTALQRMSEAFTRYALSTLDNKSDDVWAERFSRWLKLASSWLDAVTIFFPRIATGKRREWTPEERASRTSDAP